MCVCLCVCVYEYICGYSLLFCFVNLAPGKFIIYRCLFYPHLNVKRLILLKSESITILREFKVYFRFYIDRKKKKRCHFNRGHFPIFNMNSDFLLRTSFPYPLYILNLFDESHPLITGKLKFILLFFLIGTIITLW